MRAPAATGWLKVLALGALGIVWNLWLVDHVYGQEPMPSEEPPTVVSQEVIKPPKRVENIDRFTPEATPTWPEAKRIARLEQARWGGPSIIGRMWCESTGRWWKVNGPYRGLLQIGSIWGWLYSDAPRGVRLVKKRRVRKPIVLIKEWSNGVTTRDQVGSVRQKRVRIRKGKLPGGASPHHGWASIRVGQRAVSGGRSTSWSCGL